MASDMKFKILFATVTLSTLMFSQSSTDWINANLFYALQVRATTHEMFYYTPKDFQKFKSEMVKTAEEISGKPPMTNFDDYDVSLEGIERFYNRKVIDFDQNGNPVKLYWFKYDTSEPVTRYHLLTFNYGSNGLMSGATIQLKDTTGKIEWEQEIVFTVKAGKITALRSKNKGQVPDWLPEIKYELTYKNNGSLNEMKDSNHTLSFSFDDQNRLSLMRLIPSEYTFSYNKEGSVASITSTPMFDDPVTLLFVYNQKGELLSTGFNSTGQSIETKYTNGTTGLPVTAKEVFRLSGSVESIINFEYRYTKW